MRLLYPGNGLRLLFLLRFGRLDIDKNIFELGDHFTFFDKNIANFAISLLNWFLRLILLRIRRSLWGLCILVLWNRMLFDSWELLAVHYWDLFFLVLVGGKALVKRIELHICRGNGLSECVSLRGNFWRILIGSSLHSLRTVITATGTFGVLIAHNFRN